MMRMGSQTLKLHISLHFLGFSEKKAVFTGIQQKHIVPLNQLALKAKVALGRL